jgi:hypothetical protein
MQHFTKTSMNKLIFFLLLFSAFVIQNIKGQTSIAEQKNKITEQSINLAECESFKDITNFFHVESNGDSVKIEINDAHFINYFKDDTFSKLSIEWINCIQFNLTFIETNNEDRKDLGYPGYQYKYTIVEKKENYFEVIIQTLGTDLIEFLKLYY